MLHLYFNSKLFFKIFVIGKNFPKKKSEIGFSEGFSLSGCSHITQADNRGVGVHADNNNNNNKSLYLPVQFTYIYRNLVCRARQDPINTEVFFIEPQKRNQNNIRK